MKHNLFAEATTILLLACFEARADGQPGAQPRARGSSVTVMLISASEDRAGTWGTFHAGFGDHNGNGVAIANDWHWRVTLRLATEKSLKLLQIHEENSNQIWTTVDANHWPLVVCSCEGQLNSTYGDVLGPFAAGTHQLDLYGQVDNRHMYGTHLRIEFMDGTSLTAEIPKCSVRVGKGSEPVLDAAAAAPVIYGNATHPSSTRLYVDIFPEPVITRLNLEGQRGVAVEARGVPDRAYVLEAATNLAPPIVWSPVATNIAGPDGMFRFTHSTTSPLPACFYRLRSP